MLRVACCSHVQFEKYPGENPDIHNKRNASVFREIFDIKNISENGNSRNLQPARKPFVAHLKSFACNIPTLREPAALRCGDLVLKFPVMDFFSANQTRLHAFSLQTK